MSAPFDRVFLGSVVTTASIMKDAWVAARGETIAAVGQGVPPPAAETFDYTGKYILPGLVDGHMHTSSAIGWIGIEGSTRSAAAGGVTTCCDMPYDVPLPVTDAAKLQDKIGWVNRTAHVDMALYGTITKTGGVGAVPELAAGGISAFKLSTYEYDAVRFPRIDHHTMLDAFRLIARTGLPVAIHNEDQELVETLTAKRALPAAAIPSCIAAPVPRSPRRWPISRSSRWRWRPARMSTSPIPRSRAASILPQRFAIWARRPPVKPASTICA